MKLDKQILESIQRGINLAIDDIEDVSIEYLKKSKIENNIHTRDLLQWVDLDLPSGNIWASYNINAKPSNDAQSWYGTYYNWNDINDLNYTIPTVRHFIELKEYTTFTWVKNYKNVPNLNGKLCTGRNGNSIFFPASGTIYDNTHYLLGSVCLLWTSETYDFSANTARSFCMFDFAEVESTEPYDSKTPVRPILINS